MGSIYMQTRDLSIKEIDKIFWDFMRNRDFIHYFLDGKMIGLFEFITYIKYRFFKPGTLNNALYFEIETNIQDERSGQKLVMISVPIGYKEIIKKMAGENCLIIVDAAIVIDTKEWPIIEENKERLFFLENAPDHPIWRADGEQKEILEMAGKVVIRALLRS